MNVSTGFRTLEYRRWYSEKYGREKTAAMFLKAHVSVVEITDAYTHDSHMFRPVMEKNGSPVQDRSSIGRQAVQFVTNHRAR